MAESYEQRDVAVRPASLWGGGLVLAGVAVCLLVLGLLLVLRPAPPVSVAPPAPPPQPALQASPEADLARLRRQDGERLHGLGWTNPAAGLAHIPIDRAESLLVQRGWPLPAESAK